MRDTMSTAEALLAMTEDDAVALRVEACRHARRELMPAEVRGVAGAAVITAQPPVHVMTLPARATSTCRSRTCGSAYDVEVQRAVRLARGTGRSQSFTCSVFSTRTSPKRCIAKPPLGMVERALPSR